MNKTVLDKHHNRPACCGLTAVQGGAREEREAEGGAQHQAGGQDSRHRGHCQDDDDFEDDGVEDDDVDDDDVEDDDVEDDDFEDSQNIVNIHPTPV